MTSARHVTFQNKTDATDLDKQMHKKHTEKKKAAYKIKNKFKENGKHNSKLLACTFDLESVLYTPCRKYTTL